MRGLPLRLIDTAGLRDTPDPLEAAGIDRTRKMLAQADLALQVFDGSLPPPADVAFHEPGSGRINIPVLNKVDLGINEHWQDKRWYPEAFRVSCKDGNGLNDLCSAIYDRVVGGQVAWSPSSAAINARHQHCLQRARVSVQVATEALRAGQSPEFVALDLRQALDAVGEVVGGVDTEDILGRIFATFCIGK